MTTSDATDPVSTNRYAIPVADLDAVRVTQARMVELVDDGHRPPAEGQMSVGDSSADGDGE